MPNPVECGSQFIVQVKIITWDSLKGDYTWENLNKSSETWESLREKAVEMDFSVPDWKSAKKRYTWNGMERYPLSWDELKGE